MTSASSFPDWLAAVDSRAGVVTGAGRAWARNRVVLSGIGSTNALGRRVVDEYLREEMTLPEAVFVAWEQTAGRGRQGRAWVSAPGAGAWVTMVRRVADAETLARLPLAVPLGLCEALDGRLPAGHRCRIKWPNDLVVGGRKIGGVLIDGVAPRGEEGSGAAVIGFGVNLLQDEAELGAIAGAGAEGAVAATSLAAEAAGEVAAEEVVWELVAGVAARLEAAADDAALAADYAGRSAHRPGDPMRCRAAGETLEGRFRGFDGRGFLRLELTAAGAGHPPGEEVLMRAGEVVA
ncbi:MAG TPA: biotin--[acetyl-CoA-carboxylase] ligase [Thermoanaerobaculia bacterium]|nr:biotin--[acetyl-CoA-carboxylase] ligase [Thermoanaerobaculia bacterium]